MSSQVVHRRHVGDTLTLLSVTMEYYDVDGILTTLNLTNASPGDVQFKMLNAGDGTITIPLTAVNVTFTTDANGLAEYDFSAAGVMTAGIYWGYFVFTDTAETKHFPFKTGELRIEIDSDTQTGREAYGLLI